MSSVPGASLAFLGPVGGYAVVRGALYRVIVLWEGRAGGHAGALAERTERQQRRWLWKGDRKSCDRLLLKGYCQSRAPISNNPPCFYGNTGELALGRGEKTLCERKQAQPSYLLLDGDRAQVDV